MSNLSRTKSYKVSDFLNWFKSNLLRTQPEYQRNLVWKDNAKSYLIDSIIKGYPISQVFLRETYDKQLSTIREVVDGQQRISTILQFINDEFKIKKIHNLDFGGLSFNQLPDEIKMRILSFDLPCQILETKDDYLIYTIFSILNNVNYVLNKQEIRNANFFGLVKTYVENIRESIFERIKDLGIYKEEEIKRMKLEEDISRIMMYFNGGIVEDDDLKITKFYQEYDSTDESNKLEEKQILQKTIEGLEKIMDLFETIKVLNNGKIYFDRKYLLSLCIILDRKKKLNEVEISNLAKLNFDIFLTKTSKKEFSIEKQRLSEQRIEECISIFIMHTQKTTNATNKRDRVNKMISIMERND